ncbi:5100_t:CDS:2, partial [Cetraspora pellucida]
MKRDKISSALNELNNSANPKCPSINSIAKDFGLSEATLRHAAKNSGPPKCHGPSTILTKHEKNQLIGYCINMQWLGFGLTKSGWTHFIRDHPELSFHTSQELSEARAQRANATIIKDHFDKLKQIINENSLTALQVWNMDKTGFVLVPKLEKVLAKKGSRQVHKVAYRNSHKHISVVPTISAAGSCIPPLIIYKGSCAIPGLLQGAPSGTVMGFTDTDHKSHVSYSHVDFCHQNEILLYAFPPHTTHILQPSKIPFAKLKKEFGKQYDNYHNTTRYQFSQPVIISSSSQSLQPIILLSQSTPKPNYSYYTRTNFTQLITKNETLRNEIELLKTHFIATKEELETYKSFRTSSLCSVLRYNFPRALQAKTLDIPSEIRQESGPSPKKRKILPFAQLLTNDKSWQKLKEANEETEKKLEEAKQKKELVAQKKMKQQRNLEQKREE